jgi:hypothetical protein
VSGADGMSDFIAGCEATDGDMVRRLGWGDLFCF